MSKPNDNKIIGGCIQIARQMIESDIFFWKPAEWFKIWMYILLKVNHEDKRQFRRGEGYFNWSEDKYFLRRITPDQFKKCVKWLKQAQQITTKRTTRGNRITIINYNKYQILDNYYYTNNHSKGTTGAQQGHNSSTTINKNDKNVKNIIHAQIATQSATLLDYFATLWDKYPRRLGKNKALAIYKKTVYTEKDLADINKALDNYIQYIDDYAVKDTFIKHGNTWFDSWRDWIDYDKT